MKDIRSSMYRNFMLHIKKYIPFDNCYLTNEIAFFLY